MVVFLKPSSNVHCLSIPSEGPAITKFAALARMRAKVDE